MPLRNVATSSQTFWFDLIGESTHGVRRATGRVCAIEGRCRATRRRPRIEAE